MSLDATHLSELVEAVSSLPRVNSTLAAHYAAAAGPTMGVTPAAGDPVSALTAAHFSAYAQTYQTAQSQAAAALDILARVLIATVASEAPAAMADAAEAE